MIPNAVEPWELFPAYRTRPGYSLAWRDRLRELAREVAAAPEIVVRPPGVAPGRPRHAMRFDGHRSVWRNGGRLLAPGLPPGLAFTAAGAWQWAGVERVVRALPPGAAIFVDVLDRDSNDVLEIAAVTPAGLLRLLTTDDLVAPAGGTPWDWRAFAPDPAILDGVLAVYGTTGSVETALSVIEAARARGDLE